MSSRIFVLSGPSGSGKNTVYDRVVEQIPAIEQTVSATTRSPRDGETDGVDYYFLSNEAFERKIAENAFVEYVRYGKNYYGTLKSEIERLHADGKIVFLIIEVNGALRIKRTYPDACTIFILPPSVEELRRRIAGRGQNSDTDTEIRLAIAEEEMRQKDQYDFCVVNDDLETCVNEIVGIITEGVE